MKEQEKTKEELLEAIEELRKKIIECEGLEAKLKEAQQVRQECASEIEEVAQARTLSERIINKQLRHEIEERKSLEAELHRNRQFLESVVNGITEQICVISRDLKIVWANKTFLDQFDVKAEEVIGRTCHAATHNQDSPCQPPNDVCPIAGTLETGEAVTAVHVHFGKEGKFFSEVTAYPIKDGKGEIVEFVHIARDITGQKKAEEELRQLSVTDPLTGLYNRRGFLVLAQQQIKLAKRHKQDLGLLFIDLDGLKVTNDTLGHAQGDAALREAAVILVQSFRESDIVARLGGDEFVVLAIQTGKETTDALTAGLRKRLEERNARPGAPYPLKMSIGVAYCEAGAACAVEDLLSRADRSMYEKKGGCQGR
jgi:diguanylate cyclase (GGDEF)-like protein/PAS domain S-box-containing protein